MIRSFRCRETEKIFHRLWSKKFPPQIQRTTLRKLEIIHAATSINDLRIPPANHLKALKGNKTGRHSIRINDQWRICFKWEENNAYEVEIIDYH